MLSDISLSLHPEPDFTIFSLLRNIEQFSLFLNAICLLFYERCILACVSLQGSASYNAFVLFFFVTRLMCLESLYPINDNTLCFSINFDTRFVILFQLFGCLHIIRCHLFEIFHFFVHVLVPRIQLLLRIRLVLRLVIIEVAFVASDHISARLRMLGRLDSDIIQ